MSETTTQAPAIRAIGEHDGEARDVPRARRVGHLHDRRSDGRGERRGARGRPSGRPHRFVAGPDGARLLFLLTPAGLEGLILEQSVPATSRTLPPSGATAPDLEQAREVALRYGCELLIG